MPSLLTKHRWIEIGGARPVNRFPLLRARGLDRSIACSTIASLSSSSALFFQSTLAAAAAVNSHHYWKHAPAAAPPAPQLQGRESQCGAFVNARRCLVWAPINQLTDPTRYTSARSDTPTHPTPKKSNPLQVIDALLLCHNDNPYAKFLGACNDEKVALDKCFRVRACVVGGGGGECAWG